MKSKHSQPVSQDTHTTTPKRAPVDRRARMIVNSYSRKFKTLDTEFATDVVGSGKSGINCPFETAQ